MMVEAVQGFLADFAKQPMWVQVWVNFLGLVNFSSVLFVRRSRLALYVLVAITLAVISLIYLHSQFGYVRLLGLPHVILWTPMLIYFWKIVPGMETSLLKKYLYLLMATNFISLLFDYVDVARYFLGMA